MKDFFEQHYALTPDQSLAVQYLEDFLASEDSCFILRGYAGTGKTFLLGGIARYFRQLKKQLVFAAPTGRAAKVIKEKTGTDAFTIHKTIYSSQSLTEYKTEGVEGSESFKFSFGLKENEDNVDAIYIIDEASMISNDYSEGEFFRFGSGYLLNDLLEFVKPNEAGIQRKIIFVGDNAQLPPVHMEVSPALSEGILGKRIPGIKSYELTEVVRQEEVSPILSNATTLRNAIREKAFFKLKLKYDSKAMYPLQASNLAETYRQLRATNGVAGTVMIAYANSTVNGYNKLAREQLFPGVPTITPTDRVILISNNYNYEIDLFNGDFATVVAVDDTITHRTVNIKKKDKEGRIETKTIPLSFRQVRLSFEQPNGSSAEVACLIFEQLLYSDHRDLTSDETKALYVDFKIRYRDLKPGSEDFKRALRSDRMFNALRIKFGYAVTCHKAQGGEWPAVIVDAGGHGAKNNSNYFRWLYTAITRSSELLYVMDAPDYGIADGLKMVGMPGMPTGAPVAGVGKVDIGSPHPTTALPTPIVPASAPPKTEAAPEPKLVNYMFPSTPSPNENPAPKDTGSKVKAAACYQPEFAPGQESLVKIFRKVTSLTAPAGYEVTDLAHKQYHEIYSFKLDKTLTRITINYKGDGKISKMRANDMTGHHLDLIARLQPLIGFDSVGPPAAPTPGTIPSFTFPEPFLEEFYETIKSKVTPVGIHITDVQHMQYHEVYTFVRDELQAVYRFYYNGKKKFGKVSPILTKTTGLIEEINTLL
ncbi:AAA family ATPase [Neolewinella lacunae]|uniref:AAA family ATPase n=1 Tax=Neolewinella lacunae TaxID=1517758 RepID=A0A923PQF8_9BACT|nr:AAA family ATPase [Neolewinella lacunae]MBC6995896.1 AAA family ATPase [Neolewinella lacunae]MDN3636412.1 AAA family ATPase [Neolewinella lacunae]